MDDLLKEAIADAKAVRETALENAKMALEEAFTPKLQSMLSQKIQNEIEDEDDEKNEVSKVYDIAKKEKEDDDMDESKIIEIDGVKYAPVVAEEEDEDDMDEIAKKEKTAQIDKASGFAAKQPLIKQKQRIQQKINDINRKLDR